MPQSEATDLAIGVSIVIPCHNEAEGLQQLETELGPVLRALGATTSVELVLVDDGSRDQTWEHMQRLARGDLADHVPIVLARHDVNRGLGSALRTGFAAARGNVVVTTDSDATYRFSEIPHLLQQLTPEIDVVTASPYHPLGGVDGVPAYRLVLSRGSSLVYRVLAGGNVHTYTALFRAYRREVVERVPFEADGFLAVAEILVNAIGAGFRIAEYPTVLHARVAGVSKARILRTIRAHLRFQLSLVRRRRASGLRKVVRRAA
jgi:dolichol-phosphate mannosyltransferase